MSGLRVLCKLGLHRWVGTLFIGEVSGIGRSCAWCGREEMPAEHEGRSAER